jgi:Redoxin
MRASSVLWSWLAVVGLVLAVPVAGVHAQTGVRDLAGRAATPIDPAAPATVLVFTAVECPISDRYAPAVRRLAERYGARGVRFWLVYPNDGELPAAVKGHAEAFSYGLPVALDTARALADLAQATVTPEVAVFDRDGRLRYHGRIDDRYSDFGVDRPVPTTHDLDEALAAVLDGRAVTRPHAPAVGCAIVRQRP